MTKVSKGTLIVVPDGPSASVGWRKHACAPILESQLRLDHLRGGLFVADDLNDVATAFVEAAGQYLPDTANMLFLEREPESSEAAHAQNLLANTVRVVALCLGSALHAIDELSVDVLLEEGRRPKGPMAARHVELAWRRKERIGTPFGYCALAARKAKARDADYAELLLAIIERRLHWPEYGRLRREADNSPLWLRTIGMGNGR